MAGVGIYKSTDAGRTWQHMGLTDTQTIARIVVHVKLTPALTGLFGPPITDTLDDDKPAQADRVVMPWQSLAFWRASLS